MDLIINYYKLNLLYFYCCDKYYYYYYHININIALYLYYYLKIDYKEYLNMFDLIGFGKKFFCLYYYLY